MGVLGTLVGRFDVQAQGLRNECGRSLDLYHYVSDAMYRERVVEASVIARRCALRLSVQYRSSAARLQTCHAMRARLFPPGRVGLRYMVQVQESDRQGAKLRGLARAGVAAC